MANDNPRGVAALEAVLESAQETARKSLELAQSIGWPDDEAGRDIAYSRAIAFMKVSAKVGMALAKLKGEHTSNVTICRTEVHAPSQVELRRPQAMAAEPVTARFDPQTAPRTTELARKWMAEEGGDDWPKLVRDDSEDDADGEVAEGEGGPPQNFRVYPFTPSKREVASGV